MKRKPTHAGRDAAILAMRGRKSYGLIAKELGITRSTVAGVCFRADYPLETRYASSGSHNKINVGNNGGPGQFAPMGLRELRSAAR
jgi:hypothetical protein